MLISTVDLVFLIVLQSGGNVKRLEIVFRCAARDQHDSEKLTDCDEGVEDWKKSE